MEEFRFVSGSNLRHSTQGMARDFGYSELHLSMARYLAIQHLVLRQGSKKCSKQCGRDSEGSLRRC